MKVKVLFWTGFNRWLANRQKYEKRGVSHPALNPRWIRQRFNIWKATAYKSMVAQTFTDWDCAIGCNAQTEQITRQAFAGIPKVEALHSTEQTRRWLERVLKDYDTALVVRLDSDDMYHSSAAEEAADMAEGSEYLYWRYGYGRQMRGNIIYLYDTKKSGPFFAHRYETEKLIERGTMGEPHHHLIIYKRPMALSSGKFMVNIHNLNLSTHTGMSHFGKQLNPFERGTVLRNFGLI